MFRNIVFTLVISLFLSGSAFAKIDVVYPTTTTVSTGSASVIFSGNTNKGAKFYINSTPVKLWNGNFFVQTVDLKPGRNVIKLVSKHNKKREEKTYIINRTKEYKGTSTAKTQNFIEKDKNISLYSKTISDRSTIRQHPSDNSNRVVDLQKDVILYLSGKKGNYYKIEETGNSSFWIHKSNIIEPIPVSNRIEATLKNIKYASDDSYSYVKFNLSHPVLYSLKQDKNSINLTLYGVTAKMENAVKKSDSKNYEYSFNFENYIPPYEGYYEDNIFIFKVAKLPRYSAEKPLDGVKIFIDAGHGGSERGTVGPTRINEKDINLAISKYLTTYLKNAGADVSTSRTSDTKVALYDRVKAAKEKEAFISLSIHNNSLPNGKDPYKNHGTEVHYYNDNAELLAKTIQKNLAADLSLKDNGVHKSNFALIRSSNPMSVLIEVAYMMNPNEYILLQNAQFQKNVAKSIKRSLEEYFVLINNQ